MNAVGSVPYLIEECHCVTRIDGKHKGEEREEAGLECRDGVLHGIRSVRHAYAFLNRLEYASATMPGGSSVVSQARLASSASMLIQNRV